MKEGWEYKKLGECLSYIKNGANIKQTKGAKGIPITRIETLSGGVFNRDRLGYADIFTTKKYSQYIMDDGDILMSHINSKAYIGRAVLYRKEDNEQIIHGMNLLRLKVIPSLVHSNYLNLLFKSYYFRDRVAKIRKDAVNQSSMAISDLVKIPILIPPLAEQERIVAELDLLSSIIDKKKAQLKELDQLAQSIFYTMFGDPITNEKGWESTTIGKCCMLKSGNSDANNSSLGTLPYVKVGDMNIVGNETYIITSSTFVDREENKKNIFPIGTTIFPKRGGAILTNKKRITSVEICCDLNVMGVIPNREKLHPLYIYFYFLKLDFAVFGKTGSTIPQINNHNIAPMKISLPPLPLQQEFASKIEAIERQKTLIQQSIVETQTLFDSRMDYWFD